MLSNSLSTSERRADLYKVSGRLAEFCNGLYMLLIAHADDWGRLPGDESTVKLKVDPISPRGLQDFVAALRYLHQAALIDWYQVEGRKVIEIRKFDEHQDLKGHTGSRQSKLPACPSKQAWIGVRGESLPQIPPIREPKRTEPKGREKNVSSEPHAASEPPSVLDFPTIGPGGPSWPLSESQLDAWRRLFPPTDILAEMRKALAWIHANPERRKTARGMPRFLVRWLSRATDAGRAHESRPPQNLQRAQGLTHRKRDPHEPL